MRCDKKTLTFRPVAHNEEIVKRTPQFNHCLRYDEVLTIEVFLRQDLRKRLT